MKADPPLPVPGADQTLSNRLKERAKLLVRGVLHRVDLDLSRAPYSNRLARSLDAAGLDTILDIGANVGQFAVMTRRAGFSGRIISCEPLSGAFGQLSGRATRDPLWTPVRTAVGAGAGSTTINVSANSYSSSVLEMTQEHLHGAPGSGYIATEEVTMTTVEELVAAHAIVPARTLLKIDTQGFESEVLAGTGALLDEFGAVQLELSFVELYSGQRLFDELYELMRGHGLRIHIIDPGFSNAEGRLLQCDGLFVRDTASVRPAGSADHGKETE